jgi:hypothetical protein
MAAILSLSRMRNVLAVVFLLACGGCSKPEVERYALSGKVTYQGQPVPVGSILFEPDGSKGNRGPQGYSTIIDGYYETNKYGKGAVTGPINVQIMGFSKDENISEEGTKPLFPPFKTSIVIVPESTTFDFEIPTSHGEKTSH